MVHKQLQKEDWVRFLKLVETARNPELRRMEEVVSHEIDVSESVIAEGSEKRGRLRKFFKEGL
jgi:hypothetical protein